MLEGVVDQWDAGEVGTGRNEELGEGLQGGVVHVVELVV